MDPEPIPDRGPRREDPPGAGGARAPLPAPARLRRAARELGWIALFAALAVALTWPLAAQLGRPASLRGDTFNNLWNAWWMATAWRDGVSPWWTDLLHHPVGISLARHTLSPLNAGLVALASPALGLVRAFDALVIAHFAFAGWAAFLLARALGAGAPGALLAGIVYAFSPYHYAYLAQINVASLGFLPLALLFLWRLRAHGRARDVVGVAVSAALLAASAQYYLVYAALLGAALLVSGRGLAPAVPVGRAAVRMLPAALAAGLAVAGVVWPMVAVSLGSLLDPGSAGPGTQAGRANDLLGYPWLAPPERYLLSWPTFFGWAPLALLVAGRRGVRQEPFWWIVALVFAVLGLGATLRVGGVDTGLPLPYALFDAPVLSMLRKADRFSVVVLLAVAVLVAFAWRDVAHRLAPGRRRAAFALVAALVVVERAAVPLETFALPHWAYLDALADDTSVRAVVHLPTTPGRFADARYDWAQTVHGKPMPQGYTTSLALTPEHARRARRLLDAQQALGQGDAGPLVAILEADGIDRVILHKTAPRAREPLPGDGTLLWAPFVCVRAELVRSRQLGPVRDAPVEAQVLAVRRAALEAQLGPPEHEDADLVVFRRRPVPGRAP